MFREKETLKKIKFKLEYMLLMRSCGRTEEEANALQDIFDLLGDKSLPMEMEWGDVKKFESIHGKG